MPRTTNLSTNLAAFLDMIATSEGTATIGDDGYNVLVGATPSHPLLFSSYAAHPNIYNAKADSTAAGRYQLLHKYAAAYTLRLHLPDFSPESQDKIAIEQIKESCAYAQILAGHFAEAVRRCAHIWASLPGAGYGQHENKIAALQAAYTHAGGTCATA